MRLLLLALAAVVTPTHGLVVSPGNSRLKSAVDMPRSTAARCLFDMFKGGSSSAKVIDAKKCPPSLANPVELSEEELDALYSVRYYLSEYMPTSCVSHTLRAPATYPLCSCHTLCVLLQSQLEPSALTLEGTLLVFVCDCSLV